MTLFCPEFVHSLLRATVVQSISAILVMLLLHGLQVTSLRIRRMACFMVVLQGCLLSRIPVNVSLPVSAPESKAGVSSINQNHSVTGESDLSERFLVAVRKVMIDADADSSADTAPQISRESWSEILCGLWLAGILVALARVVMNTLEFWRCCRAAVEPSEEWAEEWQNLLRQSARKCRCKLQVTSDTGPLLCWWPGGYQLLVPESLWTELGSRQRSLILRHELAHLQRWDVWKSLAIHLMALVQWFNPLVWLMVRRFEREAEWACDESVRRAAPDCGTEYARTLLRLGSVPGPALWITQAAGGHGLADRIRRLVVLNPRKDSKMKKTTIVTVLLALTAIPLLQVQIHAAEASEDARDTTSGLGRQEVPGLSAPPGTNDTPPGAAGTEAVLDLKQLFDGLDEIREETEKIVAHMKEHQARFDEEVRQLQEKLKTNPDDPDCRKRQDEMTKRSAEMKSVLSQKEADLYAAFYKRITPEISQFAREKGIQVVRRTGGKFHTSAAGVTLRMAPSASILLNHSKSQGDSTDRSEVAGEVFKVSELRTLVVSEVLPELENGHIFLDVRQQIPSDGANTLIFKADTVSVHLGNGESGSPDKSVEAVQLLNKEILFGQPTPVRDITQELTDRLNSLHRQKKAVENP